MDGQAGSGRHGQHRVEGEAAKQRRDHGTHPRQVLGSGPVRHPAGSTEVLSVAHGGYVVGGYTRRYVKAWPGALIREECRKDTSVNSPIWDDFDAGERALGPICGDRRFTSSRLVNIDAVDIYPSSQPTLWHPRMCKHSPSKGEGIQHSTNGSFGRHRGHKAVWSALRAAGQQIPRVGVLHGHGSQCDHCLGLAGMVWQPSANASRVQWNVDFILAILADAQPPPPGVYLGHRSIL